MRDFHQWVEATHNIQEKGSGIRRALGAGVPDSYGAGQYPPAYLANRDAGALGKLQRFHPNVLKNTNPKPKRKKKR